MGDTVTIPLQKLPAPALIAPTWAVIGVLVLGGWFLLRVVLWLAVGPAEAGWGNAVAIFGFGLLSDLAALSLPVAPLLLVLAVLPNFGRTSRWFALLRWAYVWFAVAVLLFSVIAEYLFWKEFAARFNFIAVDYLIYTQEVIDNILQTYPVDGILVGIAILAFAITLAVRGMVTLGGMVLGWRTRVMLGIAGIAWACIGLVAVLVVPFAPTGNAYADELQGNGMVSLLAAFRRNELSYDRFYRTIPQDDADRILTALDVERMPLTPALQVGYQHVEKDAMGPFVARPRNVVLVTVESLSAEFVGVYGNRQALTPNLDRMSAQGLRFERFFATGTRTVRGLEAMSLGVPPVPGQSIVRRPGNEHLATLGEMLQMQGYATHFIYGGYGYFDNMNAYFRGNDYEIVDRTDFPEASIAFANAWGVADETLFANATAVIDRAHAQGKPFFTHIMTTSNHRPFTYPDGRIDIASPGSREGAVKYTDYAIGKWIAEARTKPWFDDTLFLFTADHCASVAGKTRLPVAGYRIPLLFYAPKLVPPGVIERMASQIDLPPTILDLLGAAGDEHFFGQGLFEPTTTAPRAFISNYQELGYYKNDVLTVLQPRHQVQAYAIDPVTFAATLAPIDQALLHEAIAYYQTAARAFTQGALASPRQIARD